MTIKLLGLAAAIALCPGVILAQTSSKPASTSSAGEVAASVPQKAIDEQKDPSLIGSPAWWTTRATADGQPMNAAGERRKP